MIYTAPRYRLGNELDVRILVTSEDTEGRHDLVDAFQLPHTMTPFRTHTRYQKGFTVVEGTCTIWLGSKVLHVTAGDLVTIPINVPHAIKAGPRGCRTYLKSSPAAVAELIARTATPADRAAPDTTINYPLFVAVSAELGDQILGPRWHGFNGPSLDDPPLDTVAQWARHSDHCVGRTAKVTVQPRDRVRPGWQSLTRAAGGGRVESGASQHRP
jgi:quercetin dioxygenase-like cupin family protein